MRQHTIAIEARVKQVPVLSLATHLGRAPKVNGVLPIPPYALIYPRPGSDTTDRLDGPKIIQNPAYTILLVGSSVANVEALHDAVKPEFILNGRPVPLDIPGEMITRFVWDAHEIDQDEDLPSLFFQPIEISFTAEPVAA